MALCGYPLTSARILSYSRKIGDEKIVEENSWFRLDKTFNISTIWLHSENKQTAARLQSELEFEQASSDRPRIILGTCTPQGNIPF